LAAFGWWEHRSAAPIVNFSVLRYPTVWAGSLLGMVLGISLYGSVLILPQYTQGTLGFTATLSGLLLVMRAGAVMLFTPPTVALVQRGRLDTRWLIGFGFVIIGISNFMLASVTTTQSSFWTFFGALALSGVGLSQIFVPLSITVLGSVQGRDVPAASAFFNLSRQLGGSIAIAVLVTILARNSALHHEELAGAMTLSSVPVANYVAHAGGVNEQTRSSLNALVNIQANVLAYADTARFTGFISLALAPLAIILRRPKPAGGPPPPIE
ncbi:MAG TPA: MFS transporter, partial [Candidatus Baltobacteraceae bacterium]